MVSIKKKNTNKNKSKWPKWLINGGGPNYLLSGMALQVGEWSSRNHEKPS